MAPASRSVFVPLSRGTVAEDARLDDASATPGHVGFIPSVDVYEVTEGLVIELEAPGVPAEAIRVTIGEGGLLIEGTKADPEAARKRYLRAERAFGAFRRHVVLPSDARMDAAAATLREGVLRISVPRGAAGRRIAIAE